MLLADRFRLVWTPFLKKTKRGFSQAVQVVCPPALAAGGELTLHLGKKKYTAQSADLISCPGQLGSYLWLVPRSAKPTRCRATWKTPQGKTYRDSILLKPAGNCCVHVAFKAGRDIVQDDPVESGAIRLFDNLDKIAAQSAAKSCLCTVPSFWLEQSLDKSSIRQRRFLQEKISTGQIACNLAPFDVHSEFLGLEEMCRSLYAARRVADRCKARVPTAASMTDVPAHNASLAMAMVAAGGTFIHIGAHAECSRPKVPGLFWWKLPDGKRILCRYEDQPESALLPNEDWAWGDWLAVRSLDESAGATLEQLAWIKKNFDSPVYKIGRLEDYADAVISKHGKNLPEHEVEFVDWWAQGFAAQAAATAQVRRGKDRLVSAEILETLSGQLCKKRAMSKPGEFTEAYRQLSAYSEHTWDGTGSDGEFDSKAYANSKTLTDEKAKSWKGKVEAAEKASQKVAQLESRVLLPWSRGKKDKNSGVTLFNTLSWARGGLVRIADHDLPSGEFELIDPTNGQSVLYDRRAGNIEFIAPSVPPCGYLRLEAQPVARRSQPGLHADWEQRTLCLHTSNYSMQFNEAGGMSRWYDRMHSCQWCSDEVEFPMGSYLYEMPGSKWLKEFARNVHGNCQTDTIARFHRPGYEAMEQFGPVSGSKAKVRSVITPLYARVIVEAACPVRKVSGRSSGDIRRYRTTFTKYAGLDDLYINMQLIGKRPTLAAEAGYAYFPFFGDEPFTLVDRIAHMIRPGEELADGVNAAQMVNHHGVRVEKTHAGMNVYPLDSPLVCFDEPGAYRFEDDGDYESGELYATLFNNCWGSNFAQWQSGDFSFDFVLNPTRNDDWDGQLSRRGAEVYRPLLAVANGRNSQAPRGSLLKVDPSKVQLVNLKSADFGKGMVVRLWNSDVDPKDARIQLTNAKRGQSAVACDLLERPGKKRFKIDDQGGFRVPMQPNEIVTLLLA